MKTYDQLLPFAIINPQVEALGNNLLADIAAKKSLASSNSPTLVQCIIMILNIVILSSERESPARSSPLKKKN
jgi:hypothetical protein